MSIKVTGSSQRLSVRMPSEGQALVRQGDELVGQEAGTPVVQTLEVRLATSVADPDLPTHTAAGAGVGRTLTASADGALVIDATAVAAGDRILYKGTPDGSVSTLKKHGIYVVTDTGAIDRPWVLTRAADFDEESEIRDGVIVHVADGEENSFTYWVTVLGLAGPVDTTMRVSFYPYDSEAPAVFNAGRTRIPGFLDVGQGIAAGGAVSGLSGSFDSAMVGGEPVLHGPAALASFVVNGAAAAGPVAAVGVKLEDSIVQVLNLTDGTDGRGSFEAVVTVADQIQQTDAANLAGKLFSFLVIRLS